MARVPLDNQRHFATLMRMNRTISLQSMVFASLVSMTLLGGCTTVRETFAGHDPDQVWTALKAVANSPSGGYSTGEPDDRWTVRENRVWADEPGGRIEIYRALERELYQPGGAVEPLHQERTWKLRVRMIERDPPTVEFTSRQWGGPAHAWDEAARYFEEVREILGEPATEGSQSQPASGQ